MTRTFDEVARRRAMSRSLPDGIAYAVMVGAGESFFTANAIKLGATPLEIGLIIAVPLLAASIGPLFVVRLLRHPGAARRPLVATAALVQAIGLATIALLNAIGHLDPIGLLALLCLHQICGQSAGVAWSSWYAEVVPADQRGRWFAQRTRMVQVAAFVGLVGGGYVLHELEPTQAGDAAAATPGFALVFGIAALARFVSAFMLWISPEPRSRGLASRDRLGRFFRTRDGRNVSFLLGGGIAFQAAVYVASPYFTPFMLERLQLDYASFTVALGAVVVAKFVALPAWGHLVDRIGPRTTYRTAILMAALVPAPWLIVEGPTGAALAQALSGVAWAGHEVAMFALLLSSTRASVRPQVLAAQSACNAAGQFGGSMIGAAIVGPHGFLLAFATSVIARVVVAIGVVGLIRDPRRPRPHHVILRVAGYRPGAGMAHRPVVETDPAD